MASLGFPGSPQSAQNALRNQRLHYALTGLLAFIVLLQWSRSSTTTFPVRPGGYGNTGNQPDLPLSARLARSEELYQRSRAARKELTHKFGSNPEAYPENTPNGPWPAMTVWDYLYPAYNCPHELERIGATGDGGKWMCGVSTIQYKEPCVIYSFGINLESSFEAGLLERTKCEVWGYDFSVDSFGPEIPASMKSRTHFYKFGLDGKDNHHGNPPMYTLESLMKMNGHDFIDVLKIDIETSEFSVMEDIISNYKGRPLPFGQLSIEVHAWESHFKHSMSLVHWFDKLEQAGLRPFMAEPNMVYFNYHRDKAPEMCEYSFINTFGRHELLGNA